MSGRCPGLAPKEPSYRAPAGRRGHCHSVRFGTAGQCRAMTGRPGPGLGGSGRHWSHSRCRWAGRLLSSLLHQSKAVNPGCPPDCSVILEELLNLVELQFSYHSLPFFCASLGMGMVMEGSLYVMM